MAVIAQGRTANTAHSHQELRRETARKVAETVLQREKVSGSRRVDSPSSQVQSVIRWAGSWSCLCLSM